MVTFEPGSALQVVRGRAFAATALHYVSVPRTADLDEDAFDERVQVLRE